MKRHPDLHQLSREHQPALVLARRAEQIAASGDDPAVAAAWIAVEAAFRAELGPHFAVEERHLLPPLARAGAAALAQRAQRDHDQLRALLAGAADPRERLRAFGGCLRAHVRFEEAELFPAAEAALSDLALAAVAQACGQEVPGQKVPDTSPLEHIRSKISR
jgi:hemerythrin-like domain-containing protein